MNVPPKFPVQFLYAWLISVGVMLLLHWVGVCRILYQHRQRFPTGFLPWRMPREIRLLRDILRAHAKRQDFAYLMLILMWFNVAAGVALVLYYIWVLTQPPA